MEKNFTIDPHEFAMALISNTNRPEKLTNQRFIKNQLTLYLEVKQIENMKQQQMSELFDKMLSGRFTP